MNKITNNKWMNINECPLCYEKKTILVGLIPQKNYIFGDLCIPYPESQLSIKKCTNCSLFYKSCVPTQSYISEIFESQLDKAWIENYQFAEEKSLIINLVKKEEFDILDIGASNGALLSALNQEKGRRSALDVVEHKKLKLNLKGEFIQGFLDESNLQWSLSTYDIITIFDVIEHAYNPRQIFENLSKFVKRNGYIVIETGDTNSKWVKRFGIQNWWYVALFEHHIFWNKESLEFAANLNGFKTVLYRSKRHKNVANISLNLTLYSAIRSTLYSLNPNAYKSMLKKFGKKNLQPFSPFTKDHLLIVFQRN